MLDGNPKWIQELEAERNKGKAPPPPTTDEKIKALRDEIEGLRGRLKDELLAELRVEVERAIAMRQR